MRSPKDMGIIEIDITNARVHQCANCTRFCGHHKKHSFMSFDMFKKAIDSLEDWEGMIGIIGGEPTLHPEFERFLDYLKEKRVKRTETLTRKPIYDMQMYSMACLTSIINHKTVLLSALAPSYYKHFEIINETFSRQLVNDHSNVCEHQALLMPRKELGIPDEEWEKKRDACWIQNSWSATITPKGAFFCEVAGALDMLFDGPGGWKIEKGWIEKTPKDFSDQLHWCELCSACLDVPKRLSSDERDDVTPEMYKKLLEVGSPKAEEHRCVIRDPQKFEEYKSETYLTGNEYMEMADNIRTSTQNRSLYPKEWIYTNRENLVEDIIRKNPKDWIIIAEKEGHEMDNFMKDFILNPGCIYIVDDTFIAFNVLARSVRDHIRYPKTLKDILSYYEKDKVIYFSTKQPYNYLYGGELALTKEKLDFIPEKLIIYGAGEVASRAVEIIEEHGDNNFIIAVTKKKDGGETLKGHTVWNIDEDEVMKYRENGMVFIATMTKYHRDMEDNLKRLGYRHY